MDVCIRPSYIGRQFKTLLGFVLAVVLYGLVAPNVIAAKGSIDDAPTASAFIEPSTDQLVSIENVGFGQEYVTLSARLSVESASPVEAMQWTILDMAGAVVVDGKAIELQSRIPPGEYTVSASYGFKHITEPLTVPQGSRLNISYILNTGALRILPRIKGTVGTDLASKSRVFALHGHLGGILVTTSSRPGEVLMLPAGDYRVESTFAGGNALAVTDVKVKPGIMSAIDIEHVAGLVTLHAGSTDGKESIWTVSSVDGKQIMESSGTSTTLVLRPGTYTATMTTPILKRNATFEVKAGERREIALEP
jgi:hypothetical protein